MRILVAVAAFAYLSVFNSAYAATINVMDGDHDVINGQVAGHLGLNGLGHTSTLLADTAAGWATATAGSSIIVVEQVGANAANAAAVLSFLNNGGRLIELGGSYSHSPLHNTLFGGSATQAFLGADLEVFSKTGSAAGTTFADDAATLSGLSSHHEIISGVASLGAIDVYYSGSGDPIVFRKSVGSGDYFYLGWDYCCGGTTAMANDWYGVLDSAIEFESAAVPEPTSCLTFAGLAFCFGCAGSWRKRNKQA